MSHQGLQQVQKQAQTMVLAPQMQQSLKILQVQAMDLRATVLAELETNPTLEELPMDSVSIEAESASEKDETPDNDAEIEFGEDYDKLLKLDEDWREYFAQESGAAVYTSEDAERRQHMFDSLTSETSLQDSLMQQAELSDAPKDVLAALEYLVGSLDDRGFLTSSVSDVALMSGVPLGTVRAAHDLLRGLDPAGIGSINLQDCLLCQLEQNGQKDSLAAIIIRDYYDLLLRRRIPDLARKTGVNTGEIHDALEVISTLDPAPGRRFADDGNRVVEPDVKVEKVGDDWVISLNNEYIPRLRVSNAYKSLIAKGSLSRSERDYITTKMRAGKFLISAIEQRQQTIERITRSLLTFQLGFFEDGVAKLRPLTMSQVADDVGVHETTVSRAIANKYIDTPHGIFDFKYFFTSGYSQGESGESVANTTVKDTLAKLIEAEDPAKPLSDKKIADILAERGIKIARRTVAKYREELGILPTNLRREYR